MRKSILDEFIAKAAEDCINADWKAYAAGLKGDVPDANAGTSTGVDGRQVCRSCGVTRRHLEEMEDML